jgi:hypothetical protein
VFLKKLLRSSYQIDNLLSVKKNRLCGAVIFLGSKEFAARRTKVTGLEERSHQNLFFQFSLNWRMTSRLNSSNQLPVATASGDPSCLSGLDSSDSYRIRRGSRTKRGVRADSPAWSEPPVENPDCAEGMRKRHHAVRNGGMQRVNLTVEQESARGAIRGNAWYL